jgi:hypothetical protein
MPNGVSDLLFVRSKHILSSSVFIAVLYNLNKVLEKLILCFIGYCSVNMSSMHLLFEKSRSVRKLFKKVFVT